MRGALYHKPCARGAVLLLLLALGCAVERYPLPEVAGVGDTGFGAGDSSYLLLNRQIVLPEHSRPSELFINDDGLIYVAESGSGRVSVWDQALASVAVPGLEDFRLPGVKDVTVGPEQVLFAVSGDNALWAHNLQAVRETITWGLTGGIARNRQDTLEVDTLDAAGIAAMVADRSLLHWEFLSVDSVDLTSKEFRAQLRPHVIWSGSGSTRLDAVAHGRAGRREVFVANNNSSSGSEIRRIRLRPSAVLFTTNPDVAVVYLYELASHERIAAPGTGLGTVDYVLSLDADAAGTLYLTQSSPTVGWWEVQRLTVEEFAGVDYWSFDFSLQGRALMEHDRFVLARDITYTATSMFVLDHRLDGVPQHRVQVFKRNGDFLLPLGARKVLVDTTLTVGGAPVDTLLKVWRYDQLTNPRAVAVYGNRSTRAGNEDETIYVADGDRIKLFMLSVSSDQLPVQ